MHFFSCYKDNAPLPPKMENFFVNVLIDFLTIMRYRKEGIKEIWPVVHLSCGLLLVVLGNRRICSFHKQFCCFVVFGGVELEISPLFTLSC
jgi:hypothetical protein